VSARPSLRRRLIVAQVGVISSGLVTLVAAAAILTPRLFAEHLFDAGETDPKVQEHALQALSSSFVLAGLLAVIVSMSAAVVISWLLARRVAAPLERLADAATALEAGGLSGMDEARFTSEMDMLFGSLQDMSTRLERASANRNQLMSDLSHELRTPLATLEAHVDALEDGLIEPTADTYQGMRDQISRLRRLAMDVRVAAAAQEHALELHLVDADAAELVSAAHATAVPRYAAKDVALELSVTGEPMPIRCDEVRIHQVLTNLLDNALRHSSEGGVVRLTALRSGGDALLIVSDEGAGIAPDQLQRIFERFYRLDLARPSFDGSGSGLGLTIAQAIVVDHGGTITAHSDGPGSGARFTITIPLRGAQPLSVVGGKSSDS